MFGTLLDFKGAKTSELNLIVFNQGSGDRVDNGVQSAFTILLGKTSLFCDASNKFIFVMRMLLPFLSLNGRHNTTML